MSTERFEAVPHPRKQKCWTVRSPFLWPDPETGKKRRHWGCYTKVEDALSQAAAMNAAVLPNHGLRIAEESA